MSLPGRGLYAVLNAAGNTPEQAGAKAAQALQGGVVLMQYRHKHGDAKDRLRGAIAVLRETARAGVPLLINDDVELARQIGAAGVHLGRGDQAIKLARHKLGTNAIIGATCHASVAYAQQCLTDGADYVSFGRFYTSTTKPDAPAATLQVLSDARQHCDCPVVAIGGINADNGARLLTAGANILAVSGALFESAYITRAARELNELFRDI